MLIAIAVLVFMGFAVYRFLAWGLAGQPTDQSPGFNAILGTTTENFVDDERGVVGPSEADIEAVNRD